MAARKRFAAPAAPATDPGDLELLEVVAALEVEGSRRKKTWPRCISAGARFLSWLERHDLDLDEIRALCATDRHARPVAPTVLMIAYLADEVCHDHIKPSSVQGEIGTTIAWLRGTGWSTAHLERGGADRTLIGALIAGHRRDDPDARVRIPTRPVMPDDVAAIAAVIDAHRGNPTIQELWVDAMLTFHLLMAASGMRSIESSAHLRWGWIEDRGTEVCIHTPGKDLLKYQERPETIVTPGHPHEEDLCLVRRLRRWRAACSAAGVPTGDGDLVFPAVRKTPPEHATHGVRWWGDRLWVADPMADARAAAVAEGCDDETIMMRVATARSVQRQRYADTWQEFARAAGFEPRHRFEKLGSHGLRRGVATTMYDNGTPLPAISQRLRHPSGAATIVYIDTTGLDPVDSRPLFDIADLPDAPDAPDTTALADLLDPAATRRESPRLCLVSYHGVVCGRPFLSHFDIGDGPVPACEAHGARARKGLRGDLLHRPINSHLLKPTCEVEHAGVVCGHDDKRRGRITIDGRELTACNAHAIRYQKGLTGDALTKPIQAWTRTGVCGMLHNGVACGRDSTTTSSRIEVDGERLECCSAHVQRFRTGKTGDDLTAPIKEFRFGPLYCDVTHDGVTCDNPAFSRQRTEVNGTSHRCCEGHLWRARIGATGDGFTKPIDPDEPTFICQVPHEGVPCGQETGTGTSEVVIDGHSFHACSAHRRRFLGGKTGAELTKPVRKTGEGHS